MGAHAQYWGQYVASGAVIALGPVADPKGSWGLGLIEAESETDVRALAAKDPAILSGRGFSSEIHPMPMLGLRGAQARAPVSSVTP